MSPSLPTNFNDTDALITYGKDLGITIGVGFFVPAIVLSFILIVIFIKFCQGSDEKKDVFSSTARSVLILSSIFILGIAIATCAVGWSYNEIAHQKVQDGSSVVQQVILSSGSIMLSVNDSVFDFKVELMVDVNKTLDIASNISTLLTPIDGILGVADNAKGAITNLTEITQQSADNITAIKTDLNNLDAYQAEGVISGVPTTDEIPNIGDQYLSSLNQSIANIDSITSLAQNFSDTVNATLVEVSDSVKNQLINQTIDYDNKADQVLSYFNDFYGKIEQTNKSYNKYAPDVVHYSEIRRDIVIGILVLPIVLAGLSFLGVAFKLKPILKFSAAFCFIFMFWYFLVAGLNFAAYYVINDACGKEDEIVANALSISTGEITVPGTNITEKVSEKVQLLLKCSGNTTVVDIFQFNFLIDDLTGSINTELESINEEVQRLNQTSTYEAGLADLASVENNSINLDYLQNSNLTAVQNELTNISAELTKTINNPQYNQSIEAVNNITNDLLLTNGTTVHLYYDSSNITTLNCTVDPFDKMTSSDQQDLCQKAGTAIALTIARNKAIAEAGPINGNITDINQRLDGFDESLSTIYYYQNRTSFWANEIRDYLTSAYTQAIDMIKSAQAMANLIANLIYNEVDTIKTATQCAYVGNAYTDLSHNLCSDIKPALQTLSAMMILGAVVLFTSTIVSMVTVYKIDKDYYETSE